MTTKKNKKLGFTIAELTMASSVMTLVALGAVTLFLILQTMWFSTTLNMNASWRSSNGLMKIVYGAGTTNAGIRAASAADVVLNTDTSGFWQLVLDDQTNNWVAYFPASNVVAAANGYVFCDNVADSAAALTVGGCTISLTVEESGGGRTASNAVSTFVRFRN
jgi:hypothetical protein